MNNKAHLAEIAKNGSYSSEKPLVYAGKASDGFAIFIGEDHKQISNYSFAVRNGYPSSLEEYIAHALILENMGRSRCDLKSLDLETFLAR